MKKINFVIYAFLFCTSVFPQIPILEENFNYPAGDSLGAHGWIHFSPNTVTSLRLTVTSPGLNYSGYPNSGIGNSTTLSLTGNQDSYKPLDSVVNSGSVFTCFMVNVDTAKAAGDFFLCYLPNSSLTNFQARCYVKKAFTSNNLSFGISKTTAGAGGIFYSDSVYAIGTTYLLVLKYKFNSTSNTDDEVSLFVYNSGFPPSEPSTPTVGPITGTGTDIPNISRLVLRQSTASTSTPLLRVDGINVSTEWSGALPVELTSFTFSKNNRDVNLFWTTASEINNSGFEIERSNVKGPSPQGGSDEWSKIGFIEGSGSTSSSVNYKFTDRNLNSGKYNYRLKQIDYNGNFEYYNLNGEVEIKIPVEFELSQNFPNPFNPSTVISYNVPQDVRDETQDVRLNIYDALGKEIDILVNEKQHAGFYSVQWNAGNFPSGIYFYKLEAGEFTEMKKMMLVK